MVEQLKGFFIKGNKDGDLRACLEKYTKPKIKKIIECFGENIASSAKKQDMVDKAEGVIKSGLSEYFTCADNKETDLMASLCESSVILTAPEEFERIRPLYERGFVYLIDSENGAEVIVPKDIKSEIKTIADNIFEKADDISDNDAVAEKESADQTENTHINKIMSEEIAEELVGDANAKNLPEEANTQAAEFIDNERIKSADENRNDTESDIIKYARALSNIYGVYPASQLKEIWDFNHNRGISPNDIKKALYKAGDSDGFYISDSYIVNNLLDSIESYCNVLERLKRTDIYYYPAADVLENYSESLVQDIIPEYFYIKSLLSRKVSDESEMEEIMFKLSLLCVQDASSDEIVEYLKSKGIEFESSDEFNRFAELYASWFYEMRIWVCKGYKPSELKNEKLQDRDFKFTADMEVKLNKKVGRNELCPCGSGKKFKNCCLKYIDN